MPYAVAYSIVSLLFYEQGWQGRAFNVMKNDQILVILDVWVIFPKFFKEWHILEMG